jgi:tyrosinase
MNKMPPSRTTRRDFLMGSACAIAVAAFPGLAISQNASRTRLEWQQFKTTPQYSSFYDLVRTMRANTDSSSPASWQYWADVHSNYCPHSVQYFLAWHRGYLYSFEQALQNLLNDPTFALPYWDYYSYPTMPAEFTDTATGNPFYVQRSGTNVYNALSLSPFAANVVNFQRGTANSFEPLIEDRPHAAVHNLIGGQMGTVAASPMDPIFYLHHANIDRLWDAWVRSGGKRIPITSNPFNSSDSDSYWDGSFTYAPNLTLERYRTYTPDWLGYGYANNTSPTALPPLAKSGRRSPFKLVLAPAEINARPPLIRRAPTRPPLGVYAAAAARQISASRRVLGGVTGVSLAEASISARLPLAALDMQTVQNAVSAALSPPVQASNTPRSVFIVLDGIRLLGNGANGGHFYNLYLNLPSSGGDDADESKYFLGTVGAFEISAASHHGAATLKYPATGALSTLSPSELQEVTVSFERINGDNPPQGQVMSIGEVRIEVSTDAPWRGNP